MGKVWSWLKRFGLAIAGGLALVLGAGWLWRRQRGKLGKLKDRLAVSEATKEIGRLRGMREAVGVHLEEKDQAIRDIDRALADQKRRVIEAHELGQELTDEEVEDAFRGLGI